MSGRTPREQIASRGYFISQLELPNSIRQIVTPEITESFESSVVSSNLGNCANSRNPTNSRNWVELDRLIACEVKPGGLIYRELQNYAEFTEIEFIISIRSSLVEPDEDGIWHDDGSRVLAFSLSLTLNPHEIEGGRLEIRKRAMDLSLSESEIIEHTETAPLREGIIPTPAFGTLIVFATGVQGFEHKINRVIRGERIIIAGWCK